MTSVLDRLPRASRVGIVRLRSLGDCVLTTPAIRLLKAARPDLSLAICVEPQFAPVFEGNPDLDAILPPVALALRRFRPDLCLNLHGGPTSARITALSGARFRAGYAHFRFRRLYNVPIPTAQSILGVSRTVHTAEHVASAMFHLGVPGAEIPTSRIFTQTNATAARPYAVIHPIASETAKTWPADRFLAVAAHLQSSLDLEPVFIAGPHDDLSAFERFAVRRPPLDGTKQLLSRASLFLGNDSGPAHMAAAFQVPSVVLFGPSNPAVWGPWRTSSEVLSAPAGIANISSESVIRALEQLLVHA